jgi:putative thiazole-containing bacteriocin maturation protein
MESNKGTVHPSMRLKVKTDTFFLPGMDGGVYFRNNEGSFQMEGKSVFQWVERLLPALNGRQTLHDLTDGLPEPYQKRVYEIANVLFQNGFARDVSQDLPHQLSDEQQSKYRSQIEFLDSLVGSGAYHFQTYQQLKVLAAGAGSFLVPLVRSLFESGIPFVTVLNDEDDSSWREAIRSTDVVMYVAKNADVDKLLHLQTICREEGKLFLPAICTRKIGILGPLVRPDSEVRFESMWNRIHRSVLENPDTLLPSPIATSILANLLVFELFKFISGAVDPEFHYQFYVQNPDTLEGDWHPFLPHPVDSGFSKATIVNDLSILQGRETGARLENLLQYFGQLTDTCAGIFHIWDEGNFAQLPVAACRVQVVSPMSGGPAELLPEIVCQGLTHEQARCEAGFTGIESYVQQMVHHVMGTKVKPSEFVGIGTGATIAEAIWRGLHKCLTHELTERISTEQPTVTPIQLCGIEDETCAYYLRILQAMDSDLVIGIGENVLGFPVAWVGSRGEFVCSTGLCIAMALRHALEQFLMAVQFVPPEKGHKTNANSLKYMHCIVNSEMPQSLIIPEMNTVSTQDILSAVELLKQNGKNMVVFDMSVEPFLNDVLPGVFGVLLRQGESL